MRREEWEQILCHDSEDWIVSHSIWKCIWKDPIVPETISFDPKTDEAIFLEDPQARGFMIIQRRKISKDKLQIYFAYTRSEFRRQNVMASLLKNLEDKYPGRMMFLECVQSNNIVWQRLGFRPICKEECRSRDGWFVHTKRAAIKHVPIASASMRNYTMYL